MVEQDVIMAALAGLLHDVGKFALRAGIGASRAWDDDARRDFKYKHALLTWDFVEKNVPPQWHDPAKRLAGDHHRPTRNDENLIRLADQLSAGERASGQDRDDSDRKIHPKQLQSIFCSVTADSTTAPEKRYLPLKPLKLDKNVIFPSSPEPDENKVWQLYADLWDDFCREAGLLRGAHTKVGDLAAYLESMQALMQRYTWCIPSAYFGSIPDVSLYDHSRMTAALAALLVDSELPEKTWNSLQQNPEECQENVALLVGGDLSGVQDFIYTISNRGATPALRGRSFYLQLLTEVAARYILRELGLPVTNLIYASGGNFYLFARARDIDRLAEIQSKISRILYHHHHGDLYMAVSAVLVKGSDFFNPKNSITRPFGAKWFELGQQLAIAKNRRFNELGEDELDILFSPEGHGGNQEGQCQVCGLERDDWKVYTDELRKCSLCGSFEDLGDDLRKANYLAITYHDPPVFEKVGRGKPGNSWADILRDFGFSVSVVEKLDNVTAANLLLALKDEALPPLVPASRMAVGRRLLVNTAPLLSDKEAEAYSEEGEKFLPGRIKPFSVLAKQSQGIERLGILRMDVDNLGQIFAKGLRDATPSRMASLSFAISLYFEGWLAKIAEQVNNECRDVIDPKTQNPRGDVLYTIYSGGDDLFFVGAWDAVVELARRIRRDLTPYAADHPGIHLSGGIALAGAKYPLAKAAQDAHEAEAQAKSKEWWNGHAWVKKDVVSFLEQATPWNQFGYAKAGSTTDAYALMQLLKDEVEKKTANHKVLRLLIHLFAQYIAAEKERARKHRWGAKDQAPQPLWGRWNWLSFYFLRYYLGKDNSRIRELADVLKTDPNLLPIAALAARWVELLTRNN